MRNSTFFKEAAIIANHALKYRDPLGVGLRMGRSHLLLIRSRESPGLCRDLFEKHADYYMRIARTMVLEYQDYQKREVNDV